jgi:hypothetical protein
MTVPERDWQDIPTPLAYDPTASVSVSIGHAPITFSSDRGKGVPGGDLGYYDHMTPQEARRLANALLTAAAFVAYPNERTTDDPR